MNCSQLEITMEGLIATAIEKINVLGWEEAKEAKKRATKALFLLSKKV